MSLADVGRVSVITSDDVKGTVTIRIKNVPFRVIGVLAPKGQSAQGSDQDDVIFIPFSTAERKVFGTSFIGSVGAMFGSTDQVEDLPMAAEQIAGGDLTVRIAPRGDRGASMSAGSPPPSCIAAAIR